MPGQGLASFGRGFDRLLATGVQEIQVGILKRLRGAPIAHHTEAFQMLYSPLPPYELLGHRDLERAEMARMRRFARYWDSFANSGRFARTLPLLLEGGSAFERFLALSEWLHERFGQSYGLSLMVRLEAMFEYLVAVCDRPPEVAAQALYADHRRVVGKDHVPEVLRPFVDHVSMQATDRHGHIPGRQRRHLLEN